MTHRDIKPRHCTSCRKVWAARKQALALAPKAVVTNATVMDLSGLALRTVQKHTAHLRLYGCLDEDNRPIEGPMRIGDKVPAPGMSPQLWAERAPVPCGTCHRIIVLLADEAGGKWYGQVRVPAIAKALNLSERTVKAHLRHGHGYAPVGHSLKGARLVGFRTAYEMTGRKYPGRGRQPDFYILAPERETPTKATTAPTIAAPRRPASMSSKNQRCACACGCGVTMRISPHPNCPECRRDPTCASQRAASGAPPPF